MIVFRGSIDKTVAQTDGKRAVCGIQRTSVLLQFIANMSSETDFTVWAQMMAQLYKVRNAWRHEPENVRNALMECERQLVSPQAHLLGWKFHDSEDPLLSQHKARMLRSSGMNGDKT
jgi:aminopeptidase 2